MAEVRYFNAGERQQIGESRYYSPNGWINPDGRITICLNPEIVLAIDEDGETTIWKEGRKSW
jgi:hypothetical protein